MLVEAAGAATGVATTDRWQVLAVALLNAGGEPPVAAIVAMISSGDPLLGIRSSCPEFTDWVDVDPVSEKTALEAAGNDPELANEVPVVPS
jgi:hypothetical protein